MRRAAHAALSNNWLKASQTRDQTPWTAGLLQERGGAASREYTRFLR